MSITGFDCSPFHELNEPRKDDAHAEFLRSLASKEAGERSLHLWKRNSLHIQFLNL